MAKGYHNEECRFSTPDKGKIPTPILQMKGNQRGQVTSQSNKVWAEGKPMVAVPIVPIEGITQGSRNTEVSWWWPLKESHSTKIITSKLSAWLLI